ncbi:hypothetical protein F8M41_008332 [Gigaspora margarita]|uniref:Uncharacterized protein n=1 Tax=Gigaspora margarita TaxID=4874 RepID=A0A8H3X4D7_GIGMA|nr:hypothetical protein F8M41_008332 [Gigaspora margarita]
MPKYIKDIEIEELCQKIVFVLTETSEIDYSNKELKQQIFNVIEAHLEGNDTENMKKEKENKELKICVRIPESNKIEEKGVEKSELKPHTRTQKIKANKRRRLTIQIKNLKQERVKRCFNIKQKKNTREKTDGKLARITMCKSNKKELEHRKTFHARLNNLLTNTKEVLLLRQLRKLKAKAVHIFYNRNRNPRGQATVEFEKLEDKEKVIQQSIEQKEKVRTSKVVQTTEIKSDNNKEDGSSSYTTEKKGKKNERKKSKEKETEMKYVVEIIIKTVLSNIRGCKLDLIKKDPSLKGVVPDSS